MSRMDNKISMKNLWRLWAKAIGQKDGKTNKDSDNIAIIRTILILLTIFGIFFNTITNIFIIAGVIRHW